MSEPWRQATAQTPGAMRMVYTDPSLPALRAFSPYPEDRWPEHAVICMIGPFDNHMGQPELQERLCAVLRQWNAEAAERALADSQA